MSDTTPSAVLRDVEDRDGWFCALDGVDTGRLVPQHRQGGMGGRADKHRRSNVILLDSLYNGGIEADADLANAAIVRGVKISLHADPEQIPVYFQRDRAWFRLTDDGARHPLTALAALDLMHAFYGDDYFDKVAAASRSWFGGTATDASLVCASDRLRILCGRSPARVVSVSDPARWAQVTCPRCLTLRGEAS